MWRHASTCLKKRRLAAALAAVCITAGHVLAQTQHVNRERGFNANRAYDSFELDSINTFNGNLVIKVPLGKPYTVGAALGYSFNLIYNSFIWSQDEACSSGGDPGVSFNLHMSSLLSLQRRQFSIIPGSCRASMSNGDWQWCDEETVVYETPVFNSDETGPAVTMRSEREICQTVSEIGPASNAGVGWQLTFGKIFRPRNVSYVFHPEQTGKLYEVYQSPDGSEHQFFPKLHDDDPEPSAGDSPEHFFTRDNTYIRMWRNPDGDGAVYQPDGGGAYSYVLEMPNGERHFFQRLRVRNGARDHYGRTLYLPYDEDKIVRIEDQFGNWVKFSYLDDASDTDDDDGAGPNGELRDNVTEVRDSAGRYHSIHFVKPNAFATPLIKYVRLQSFGGATAEYTLRYGETAAEVAQGVADKFDTTTLIAWPHPEKGFIDGYNTGEGDMAEKIKVPYLTSIQLPGPGRMKYAMPIDTSYRPEGSNLYVLAPGALTGMTLPTGGRIEWDYEVTDPSDPLHGNTAYGYYFSPASTGRRAARISPGVRRRRVIEGPRTHTWKYDPRMGPQPAGCSPTSYRAPCGAYHIVNTVTAPTGHSTKYYYSIYPHPQGTYTRQPAEPHFAEYGLPFTKDPSLSHVTDSTGQPLFLSTQVFAAGATTPARSVYVRYETDKYTRTDGFSNPSDTNPRPAAVRTVFNDDPANTFDEVVHSDFDGLGHYRRVERHSNVRSPSVVDVSSHYTAYTKGGSYRFDPTTNQPAPGSYFNPIPLTSPWVTGVYSAVVKRDDLSDTKVVEDYLFDDTGLLRRKRLRNAVSAAAAAPAPAAHDVVVAYDYSLGNVTAEKYFGGDKQSVGAQDDLAAVTLPAAPEYTVLYGYPVCPGGTLGVGRSRELQGAGFKTHDYDIDCSTGLVRVSRDTAGNATAYSYDLLGRVTDINSQQGGATHVAYNDVSNGVRVGSPSINVAYRQSASNNTTLDEEEYRYDQLGRLVTERMRMPGGAFSVRNTAYNAMGWKTMVSEWHDGATNDGRRTQFDNFDPFGRPSRTTLPDGKVVNKFYSGLREVYTNVRVGTSVSASGVIGESLSERWERYDASGQLNQVEEQSGAGGAKATSTYRYNVLGKLAWACTAGDALSQCRSFAYNGRGLLTAESHPERPWSQYGGIDTMGNVGTAYDGAHWLRYRYDVAGRPTSVEELAGTWRPLKEFTYYAANGGAGGTFARGKLATSTRHNHVRNPYEIRQNLAAGKAASQSSTYAANTPATRAVDGNTDGAWAGNSLTHTNNDRQAWWQVDLGASYYLDHVKLWNRTDCCAERLSNFYVLVSDQPFASTDLNTARNQTGVSSYYVSRLTGDSHEAAVGRTGRYVRVQLAGTNYLSLAEAEVVGGNPTIHDVAVTEQYTYSGVDGRLSKRTTSTNVLNTAVFEQTFTYDQLGNLASQTYPRCLNAECVNSNAQRPWTVSYNYSNGVLAGVGGGAGDANTTAGTYATSISYHVNQTVAAVAHRNGVVDTTAMDPHYMQRPRQITAALGATALFDTGVYSYDGAGNVTKIGGDWYLYDKAGRLREGTALFSGPTGDPLKRLKQQYDYDVFGNRLVTRTYNNVSPSAATLKDTYNHNPDPATNRLALNYDAAGNLLGAPNAAPVYTYDALNMVVTAPGLTYLYGPDEERFWVIDTRQNGNEETYTLRGLRREVLREYKVRGGNAAGNWSWHRDYVYRGGALLAAQTTDGVRHYHLDHLGSPRLATDAGGAVRERMQSLPFGEQGGFYQGGESWSLSSGADPAATRLRFTGHERDTDVSGLDYMHARHYWARGGRFLSVDPGRDFDPKLPQSWNLYSYVRNNPVNATDPTGRHVFMTTGLWQMWLKSLLVDFATRPTGRQVLEMFAMERNVALRVDAGAITPDMVANAQPGDIFRGLTRGTPPGQDVPLPQGGTGKAILITLDRDNILATDPTGGIAALGHELYHAMGWRQNLTEAQIDKLDHDPQTERADRFGQRIARERRDFTPQQAEAWIDSVFQIWRP